MTPRPAGKHTALQLSRIAALIACMGLLGADAYALALGRISVLSALGEPLRAEIDIPDINPDEASSLRASVGSIDAFKRAGLEFNPLLSNVRVNLQRRPDGRAYLQLTGERAVNEPYLDLVVETNWAAGRLVRDYTMLFDPPNTRNATAPVQVTPAQTSPPVSVEARPPVRPSVSTSAAPVTVKPQLASRPSQRAEAAKAVPKDIKTGTDAQQVKVRTGDTASKIAAAVKPSSISLDQMLVALLRANPEAFGSGNVNRLKAGSVLTVPTAEAADSTPPSEASQIIVAQSRDFNDFRRKLAEGTQITQEDPSKRVSTGKVQTNLEEKKPGANSPDKLSLQKGELTGKAGEDKLAKELQAKDDAKRLAELNKNIAELQKLASQPSTAASGASNPVSSSAKSGASGLGVPASPLASSASAVTTTAAAASAPPTTVASAPAVGSSGAVSPAAPATTASEAGQTASAPTAAASSPNPVPTASNAVPPAAAAEEASLVSDLLENPLIPAVAGGLVALLAGLGIYRVRQRKKSNQVDSSFMESRLQPDSFFGASGGQKIDTNEAALSGSSMIYSPSQLDAGADVDPVAEADVYLAYGRDLQAEEILKEALRSNPSRAAIHFKLLQIYAKRRDVKGYAVTAADAYKLSNGLGSDWTQACEVGRELDPTNPLYQGDMASNIPALPGNDEPPDASADSIFATTNINPPSLDAPQATPAVDLDLDLDLDFSEPAPSTATKEDLSEPTLSLNLAGAGDHYAAHSNTTPLPLPDLEIELAEPDVPDSIPAILPDTVSLPSLDFGTPELVSETHANGLEFDPGALDALQSQPLPETMPVAAEAAHQALEFDLDSISLDLGGSETNAGEPEATPIDNDGLNGEDPLVTKLALAEEFQAIGDDDGARTLAQEVADAATGNLKAKAQRFLAELG